MLTAEQNELLTRVEGSGPMGRMMRDWYWVPVLRAARLEAGGAPIRLRFFGENFVAFRTEDGHVGLFDEACPHRGASLALAVNEDASLRCIFHGWKFHVSGKVTECPTESTDSAAFAAKVKLNAYPVREAGGLLWTYLGAFKAPPPFPELPFSNLKAEDMLLASQQIPCNWLQGLEAVFDGVHVGILHQGFLSKMIGHAALTAAAAPTYEVKHTPYGFEAAAIRRLPDGNSYVRTSHFALPWSGFPGVNAPERPDRAIFMSIPIDDTHTLQWFIRYNPEGPITSGLGVEVECDPDNYAPIPGTAESHWGQNRDAMKNGHFSGFPQNVLVEDMVVQVSMGPIVDRTKEFLSSSDVAIVQGRRLLLEALREYQAGKTPRGVGDVADLHKIRSRAGILAPEQKWQDTLP